MERSSSFYSKEAPNDSAFSRLPIIDETPADFLPVDLDPRHVKTLQIQWLHSYLQILNTQGLESSKRATTLRAFVSSVADTIEQALHTRGADHPPVDLSQIADCFQVDPEPIFYTEIPGAVAQLRLDHSTSHFKIEMVSPDRWPNEWLDTFGAEEPPGDEFTSSFPPQLRLTYAHELAHRFFFVRDTSSENWVRALKLVLESLPYRDSFLARHSLSRLEEDLCDQIARASLLPRRSVDTFLGLDASPLSEPIQKILPMFGPQVRDVSREFAVPFVPTVLRTFEIVRERLPSLDRNFLVAIAWAPARPDMTKPNRDSVRVKSLFVPQLIGQTWLQLERPQSSGWSSTPFPGVEFSDLCERLLLAKETKVVRNVKASLDRTGLGDQISFLGLSGWWMPLAPREIEGTEYRSGLIWGLVQISKKDTSIMQPSLF